MAHNTPLQSPTDLPSDTLHEIDSLYEEVTVTAIPFSYTSYSPPEQSSTPGELPIDMRFNDGHRIAIILYTLLMTVSAVGNMYVFGSIVRIRLKGKRSRINLFQLHLSIADLCVTFLMMPLEIGWNATVSWEAGDAMCRIMSFFRIFGLYLSGFVIMIVSLDCYFAVVKPLGTHRANRRGRVMLVFAWIASFICSSPQPAIFHVEDHPHFTWYQQCVTFNSFPSPRFEMAYNFFGFVFMYLLPLLTIIGCYSCILVEIYRINSTQRNGAELRRSNMGVLGRAKIKTLKMTVIIVTTFFLCWTPYNVMSLWYWFDKPSAQKVDQRIQKALFLFACTNSCVNPIIYGLFHFRKTETSTHASRNEGNTPRFPCRWRPNQCCVIENSESSRNTPAMTSSSSSKENQFQLMPIRRARAGLARCGVSTISDPLPSRSEESVSVRLVHSDTPCHDFGSEV